MVNELIVVAIVLAGLAISYLLIYPQIAGNDVRKMAWLDVALSMLTLGVVAAIFFGSDEKFNLFGFETNWWIFTIITGAIIELPLFFWYIKARGLGHEYLAALGFGGKRGETNWYSSVGANSVIKQLNDTKWDGLRTSGAKRTLVISSNLAIIAGTVILFLSSDSSAAGVFGIIHVILLFSFWFLLTRSVRLVADAPDSALDERMLLERNKSYFNAYRLLGMLVLGAATALMVFAVISDARNTSIDEFYYQLEITWPQVQGAFWLLFGYAMMLPSMTMAWQQSKSQLSELRG